MPMTAGQKLRLLHEVYNAVAAGVESLERDDRVGPDLAYLLGAILNGTACSWPKRAPRCSATPQAAAGGPNRPTTRLSKPPFP